MTTYDPMDADAREKLQALRDAKAIEAQKLEANDIRWLMGTKQGRRLMWALLSFCGIYHVAPPGTAPHDARFFDGMRNVGVRYADLVMQHSPDEYGRMRRENIDREQRANNDEQ